MNGDSIETGDGWTLHYCLVLATLCFISFLIQGCTLFSLGIYLPAIAPFAQTQQAVAGSAGTALLLAMSIANLPVGWAMDRFGARAVLIAGVLGTALGCVAAAQAQSMTQLVVAMALIGAGIGATSIVPGVALILRHPHRHQGVALAIFLGAGIMAGAAMPPVINIAVMDMGWRSALLLSGCGVALLCLPPLLFMRIGGSAGEQTERPLPGHGWMWAALRDVRYLRFALASTMIQLSINGVLFAAIACLVDYGYSQEQAVWSYSIANFLALPSLFFGGMLADRYGARPVLTGTLLLLAAGTALLLLPAQHGLWGIAAFTLLWGLASGLPGQVGSMLLADIVAPQRFAPILGMNTAIISLIGSLAPLLTDKLMTDDGGYPLPIGIYAMLALFSAPLIATLGGRIGHSKA